MPTASPVVSVAVPAHRFRRPRPPPRVALRGAPCRRAPPFFFFSSRLVLALLAIRLYHRCTLCQREVIVAPSPSHRPPRRSCASFLLERDYPQATAPSVTEEKDAVQSPVHRASPRGPAALTVPRGRLRRHDLHLNSSSLHDLRAGALHHSSGLPPMVPSRPTRALAVKILLTLTPKSDSP
jgi:hypothetical protein